MANRKVQAKREAWKKKEEAQGKNLIMWMIAILIGLGIIYAIWASFIM